MAKSTWQMTIIKITNRTITRWLRKVVENWGKRVQTKNKKTRKQMVINKSHMAKSKQQITTDKWQMINKKYVIALCKVVENGGKRV